MEQFVGAIAYHKMQEWIDAINSITLESFHSQESIHELQNNINLIGDDFIRTTLQQQLKQKLDSLQPNISLKQQILMLENQLDELKKQIRKNDTN